MTSRTRKIIVGNWKMNPLVLAEAEKLFGKMAQDLSRIKKTDIVVCPPVVYLNAIFNLLKAMRYKLKPSLGAQDAFWGDVGAFTGEVSASILYNLGARYVILGHSEKRSLGETNVLINKKVRGALVAGLKPILCVGESARDENHNYFSLVKGQVAECLAGISKNSISKIIVAYEPIWAISTTANRRNATSGDCREMAIFIRKVLSDKFGAESQKVKVIYGGSVNEKDALEFLQNGGVDGLLPGRASLDAEKFTKIVKI